MRAKGLARSGFICAAVLLLVTGCGDGGRQASPPSASSVSRMAVEQSGAPEAPSTPPSGDGETIAAPVTPPETSPSQASAPKIKACDLLTKEEVAEVIGREVLKVEPWQHPVDPNVTKCTYHLPEDGFVSVDFDPNQASWDWMGGLDVPESVAGIGEKAYWYRGGTIKVRTQGGVLLIIVAANGLTGADEMFKSMAVNLAKKAVARIQP